MIKYILKFSLISIFVLACIFSTQFVLAGEESPYVPLAPLPGTTDGTGADAPATFSTYVPGMFRLLIGVAAALAVIMIIIGGIQYIGAESLFGKQDGRDRIQKALWGLLLVIFSWLLLYTVNPDLVEFNLNIETAEVPGQQNVDTPHAVRVVYQVANTPGPAYVACSNTFDSLSLCQEQIDHYENIYSGPEFSFANGDCVTSCTKYEPPNDAYLKVLYRLNENGPLKTWCQWQAGPATCQIALNNFNENSETQHPDWIIAGSSCAEQCVSGQGGTPPNQTGYWIRIEYRNNTEGNVYELYADGPFQGSTGAADCSAALETSFPGPFPIVTPAGCNADNPEANCDVVYNASCEFVQI